MLPPNRIFSPTFIPHTAPIKNTQSTSHAPIPPLNRDKIQNTIPGNRHIPVSIIFQSQTFQSSAIMVHPTSQHADTFRNNISVAAGNNRHIKRIHHRICIIANLCLHLLLLRIGCSNGDHSLLTSTPTAHFALMQNSSDPYESDSH